MKMSKEELLNKLVDAFHYEMDWESKENIDFAMTLCLPIIEEYAQSKVNNGVLDDVSQQRELLKAFLEWQQNKYSMPYDTKVEWQIKDFEAFNCG